MCIFLRAKFGKIHTVQTCFDTKSKTYADNHRVARRTGIGLLKGENKWEDQSNRVKWLERRQVPQDKSRLRLTEHQVHH